MKSIPALHIQPNSWLMQLAQTKQAKWQWNRAIRSAICIGLPLGLGMLTGQMALGVWMSIASLMVATGESNGSYYSRIKAVGISCGLGSLGCLVGYIGVLPWGGIVAVMAVLAVLAAIISSYGAPFSVGMLQFLAISAVAIGRPQIAPFWEPTLYFLAGSAFYALMLGLEGLLLRAQPRRQMAEDIVTALAKLAQSRADTLRKDAQTNSATSDNTRLHNTTDPDSGSIEDNRRAVTTLQAALYADILGRHARKAGRTSEIDSIWALLQASDDAFAAILSTDDPARLEAAAANLSHIAAGISAGQRRLPEPSQAQEAANEQPLERSIRAMAAARQWSHSPFSPLPLAHRTTEKKAHSWFSILRDRLAPGRETLRSALALGLCVGISYAARWFDHDARWYWVPLTVAIIMKPDFGSIFARSLMRTAGTVGGALVGTVVLMLFPKGLALVLVIAALASLMPWAAQRSYVILGIVITPLILILIDLTVPGPLNVNFAGQRLTSTLIGAGIVLVFGYFFWPRTHSKEISAAFQNANQAISSYLLAVCGQPAEGRSPAVPLAKLRRIAYSRLTDLRTRLQKTMAEPPPGCSESAAWLPIVASAERICDSITAYSVREQTPNSAGQPCIRQLAGAIANAPSDSYAGLESTPGLTDAERELIHGVTTELRFIRRSTATTAATEAPLPSATAIGARA